MKARWFSALLFVFVVGLGWSLAPSAQAQQFPQNATFSTLIVTPFGVEGLTVDAKGDLFTGGNAGTGCPIWRIKPSNPSLVTVGTIPGTCNPLGIAFNDVGDLFVANGATGTIHTFTPRVGNPPQATLFASGVPGANGIAFDKNGNLWVSDGVTGQGRVWKVGPCAILPCPVTEVFRIQPMRNGTALGGDISVIPTANEPTQGVGRQARTFPHTAAGGNPQDLVANGLGFNPAGDLFVADTARGAIWKVEFNSNGTLKDGQTDCDTTFTPNTLCLDKMFVAHPFLEGADGIALDINGNIWVDANERNAVIFVSSNGQVFEVFRNPVNASGLRNDADTAAGDSHILEFPTSPVLSGTLFCTANSDGNRRDNFPNTGGEVTPAGPNRGKISCMDQELTFPGLTLPVQ